MKEAITGYHPHRLQEGDPYHEAEVQFHKEFNDKPDGFWDLIIFGTEENSLLRPKDYLTERELKIVASTLQWLGTPCGRNFLWEVGFKYYRGEEK